MSKMHLRQPADHEKLWFTSSVCGSFNRNKKRNTKIYRNKRFTIYLSKQLHKGYFQHGMADGDIKDLTRRTASDKILGVIKHLIFLKILNMMDIKQVLLHWFIYFLVKKVLVVPLCLQINLLLILKIFQTKN